MNDTTERRPVRSGAARQAMEANVSRLADGGQRLIEARIAEIRNSLGAGRSLQAEEWCALKALRGDFDHVETMAHPDGRAAVSAFENEGGRAASHDEQEASDRNDREAVSDALGAARGPSS